MGFAGWVGGRWGVGKAGVDMLGVPVYKKRREGKIGIQR